MVSGGDISGVRNFIRALRSYEPSLQGMGDLVRAAGETGLPELRQASLRLQRMGLQEGFRGARLRFAAQAPKKIYPERSVVLGRLLADLKASPNPKVRAFGLDLGLAWFRQEAVSHGIRGKDFYV